MYSSYIPLIVSEIYAPVGFDLEQMNRDSSSVQCLPVN